MEVNDFNLQKISEYLKDTMHHNNQTRRAAEKLLESIELSPNYPVLLLSLVQNSQVNLSVRLSGSIAFKNYIKRNWSISEDSEVSKIHENDRESIKSLIVQMMLTAPLTIQKQLCEAISIIGKSDFPDKWPTLFNQMDEHFSTGDFTIINGILQTAHSLFKKYRYEFRSDKLFTEIQLVLDKLAQPLTTLLTNLMAFQQQHRDNKQVLQMIFSSIQLICKIFYSLNYQDLPAFFEDNIQIWMNHFHDLLTLDLSAIEKEDSESVMFLNYIRSHVCENLSLYAQKYNEEFMPFLQQFVTDVWNLLLGVTSDEKYDILVINSLKFLSFAAEQKEYRQMFEDVNVLKSICERIILPNIRNRESDFELFMDSPENYIRNDIEGSDADTRRRAACNFLNKLSQNFETQIMDLFRVEIESMLVRYNSKPKSLWLEFDTIVSLIIALVSRGRTERHGVTQTSAFIDLSQFYETQILTEFEKPYVENLPYIIADCIKYLITFRSVLSNEIQLKTLPFLVQLLKNRWVVVHSYAAIAIQQLIEKKLLTSEQLAAMAPELFDGFFKILDEKDSRENEYAMKAIVQTLKQLDERAMPFLSGILPKLNEKAIAVSQNPRLPNFNHMLFEAIALSISIVCCRDATAATSFEQVFFPFFERVLQQDIQEFVPYVFELLAQLLEFNKIGCVSGTYLQLFPFLLSAMLWECSANVRPLVRLVIAFVERAHGQLALGDGDTLDKLLGVFQKLAASRKNDLYGLHLLRVLVTHVNFACLQPKLRDLFLFLFHRMKAAKTTQYVIGFNVFFCFCLSHFGPAIPIDILVNIQSNMFEMYLERILLPNIQKVSDISERQLIVDGLIKLLQDQEQLISHQTRSVYWPKLFEALLYFYEMPVDDTKLAEDFQQSIGAVSITAAFGAPKTNAISEYETTYTQLSCSKSVPDFQRLKIEFHESRRRLVHALATANAAKPGSVTALIATCSTDAQKIFEEYQNWCGVRI